MDFPEQSSSIVEFLLDKYDLKETEEMQFQKLLSSEFPQEKIDEVFGKLPSVVISRILWDYQEEKIDLETLPSVLKEKLNLSPEKAKDMAKDLEREFLVFIKPAKGKEELPEIQPSPEKPKPPQKKDTYREPVE